MGCDQGTLCWRYASNSRYICICRWSDSGMRCMMQHSVSGSCIRWIDNHVRLLICRRSGKCTSSSSGCLVLNYWHLVITIQGCKIYPCNSICLPLSYSMHAHSVWLLVSCCCCYVMLLFKWALFGCMAGSRCHCLQVLGTAYMSLWSIWQDWHYNPNRNLPTNILSPVVCFVACMVGCTSKLSMLSEMCLQATCTVWLIENYCDWWHKGNF
jgi:hypothetical protein